MQPRVISLQWPGWMFSPRAEGLGFEQPGLEQPCGDTNRMMVGLFEWPLHELVWIYGDGKVDWGPVTSFYTLCVFAVSVSSIQNVATFSQHWAPQRVQASTSYHWRRNRIQVQNKGNRLAPSLWQLHTYVYTYLYCIYITGSTVQICMFCSRIQCDSTWEICFTPFMNHVSEGHHYQGDENCAARGTECSDSVMTLSICTFGCACSKTYTWMYT